jgi:hypothetical protein
VFVFLSPLSLVPLSLEPSLPPLSQNRSKHLKTLETRRSQCPAEASFAEPLHRESVAFSRCPESCSLSKDADASEDPWEGQGVEGGDHIFALNAEGYLEERASFELLCLFQLRQSLAPDNAVKQRQKFEDSIPSEYHLYWDVFSKAEFDHLPPKRPWDHAIKLTKDFKPVRGKLYPLSKVENEQLNMFIDKHVATGCICPSISPMALPFFFIKKKDGTLWPVQDYRKINDMTIVALCHAGT